MMTDSQPMYSNHHAIVMNNIQKKIRVLYLRARFYLAVGDLLLERMQIASMDFGNDLTLNGSKVFDKLFSRF